MRPAVLYALLLACLARSALAEEVEPGCLASEADRRGSSLLQKENRVLKLGTAAASEVAQHASVPDPQTETATNPPPQRDPERNTELNVLHAAGFLLVIVLGTIFNNMSHLSFIKSWLSLSGKTSTAEDSIAGASTAETTEAALEENTALLASQPPPASSSLLDLLPDTSAIALCRDGADPEPVTYSQLRQQIEDQALAAFFNSTDRVAIVLDNGKEMAVCMLAVMHRACAVPLNPTFTAAELAASMEQLCCSVVVARPGAAGEAARAAAGRLGLRVLTLGKAEEGGKLLSLDGPCLPAGHAREAWSGNVRTVLLLKTSGTTSKGKVVTFSLERLSLAARYNARCVGLGQENVCLSMMPLYHIAGISVNFLASMSAGATVLFYSGLFEVKRFVAELERRDRFQPTWYFAVPAVHEAVLSHVAELGRPLEHRLAVIRSAGAALVQQTGLRLIETFDCAVTPAYGMTEALEITCPPADYRLERPGSVGPSISAEIRVVSGEICIRGELVMPGYEFHGPEDEDPNAEAWTGGKQGEGFLRTGDLGHMDKDGWVYLTGRCKEMINRGGETINPNEVEPAIATKPELDVVVCFAAPHQALGEAVAAAVVLKKGFRPQDVSPTDILKHCASTASETMRPEVFVYLPREALPTTATKKFIRAGLAQRLGLTLEMVQDSSVFVYNESSGSLEASDLESRSNTVKDSLGQLRKASSQEVVEQRLKDNLFGIGIFQVVTKHWYEGNYTDATFNWALGPFESWATSAILFMSLFFLISGHSASKVQATGALIRRWLGIWVMMTVSSALALITNSLVVNWFFGWLLVLELVVVGSDFLFSRLPETLGGYRKALSASTIIMGFLVLAALTKDTSPENWPRFERLAEGTIGWGAAHHLLDTWGNILLGMFDFRMGNWCYSMLCLWGAAFAIGFHLVPQLSKALWAWPRLCGVLVLPAFRVLSAVGVVFLIACSPRWPNETVGGWWWIGKERGTNASDFLVEFVACLACMYHALLALVLLAVAVGAGSSPLQALGQCTVGSLVTHTMFGRNFHHRYAIRSPWPFHDVLQFELLEFRIELLVFAMVLVPVLYISSIGRWMQHVMDYLIQKPLSAVPIWIAFLIIQFPLVHDDPFELYRAQVKAS